MSRNPACLIALLFANIILLVHAAVPHHYHEDTGVCFVLHCLDSEEAHTHDHYHDWHTHQHDGNSSADMCYIDKVYTTVGSAIKTACKMDFCLHTDCDCEDVLPTLILEYLSIEDFVDGTEKPFQLKPYFSSYHTEYFVVSLGLRAPPVC